MAIVFLSLIFFLTTLNWPTLVGCSFLGVGSVFILDLFR